MSYEALLTFFVSAYGKLPCLECDSKPCMCCIIQVVRSIAVSKRKLVDLRAILVHTGQRVSFLAIATEKHIFNVHNEMNLYGSSTFCVLVCLLSRVCEQMYRQALPYKLTLQSSRFMATFCRYQHHHQDKFYLYMSSIHTNYYDMLFHQVVF